MTAPHILDEISIGPRFQGPPGSVNGGYMAGRIGNYFDGPATVTLRRPPPLDTPMQVVELESGALAVMHEDAVVVEAVPAPDFLADGNDFPVPTAHPEFAVALKSLERYRGFQEHPLPGCFVCGTHRAPQDGLRIFAGTVHPDMPQAPASLVAAPWIPDSSVCGEDGIVLPEMIWSALDCPGMFAVDEVADQVGKSGVALLGRLTAAIAKRPRLDDTCVVMGWHVASDGRKHRAGTALLSPGGDVMAVADALWIELKNV